MGGFETIRNELNGLVDGVTSGEGQSVLLLGLAMVFLWSGATKLARPARAARTLHDFGVIGKAPPVAGLIAGVAELALASALAVGIWMRGLITPGTLIAVLLLMGFAALQTHSLIKGRRFACFCFGDETVQLSWVSVARAIALAAVGVLVLMGNTAVEPQPFMTVASEMVIAAAGVGVSSLVALWSRLKQWQIDPFGLRDELWIQRGAS